MPSKLLIALLLAVGFAVKTPARSDGRLEIAIVEAGSGEAVPARVRLRRADGRRVPTRGWGAAPWGDHAYLDGPTLLKLRRGQYLFDLDPGPEYRTQSGHFEIERDADDQKRIEVNRFANLADEGWLAADLAHCRAGGDLELLRRAEQLTWAPRVGHAWRRDHWESLGKPRDQVRATGALWAEARGAVWLVDPGERLSPSDLPTPGDSSVDFLTEARRLGFKTIASPMSVELPLWVAHGCLDGLMLIDGWAESREGKQWARSTKRGPGARDAGAHGAGRWRERVYHQLLEAGVVLPPLAGSGSGFSPAPIGAARAYAATRDSGPAGWWGAAERGALVVTNGPLMRPLIGGEPPGEVFRAPKGRAIELIVTLNLATRDRVEYLEILKNGSVAQMVRLSDWAESAGKLPPIEFRESGWLLVRAVVSDEERYRLATSAPSFVEVADRPRSTAASRGFFAEWLEEAAAQFGAAVPADYAQARAFWNQEGL